MNEIDFDIADVYKAVSCECFRLGACLRMAVSLDFIFDILAILSIDDNLIEIARQFFALLAALGNAQASLALLSLAQQFNLS